MKLVYYYGGMVVPNSFLCLKNLKGLYEEGISDKKPFVCENVNSTINMTKHHHKMLFIPDMYMFGAIKNSETIKEVIEYLKLRSQSPHFTSEMEFLGDTQEWFIQAIQDQKMDLIGGEMVGVKTNTRKPITVDDLMEENYLDINSGTYGIYIPDDEILKRIKYQWFASLESQQILESRIIIAKYLKASLVDSTSEYTRDASVKTVITI